MSTPRDARRMCQVFARIYERDAWTHGSGPGSTPANTVEYRRILQDILQWPDVHSVVDFGCGDWQFSRYVDWSGKKYLGLDCVPKVVEHNARAFGTATIQFCCADFSGDEFAMPTGDLAIIKDVLQHWPNRLIDRFLRRAQVNFTHLVITNCTKPQRSADIAPGEHGGLSADRPPLARFSPVVLLEYATRRERHHKQVCLVAGRSR